METLSIISDCLLTVALVFQTVFFWRMVKAFERWDEIMKVRRWTFNVKPSEIHVQTRENEKGTVGNA